MACSAWARRSRTVRVGWFTGGSGSTGCGKQLAGEAPEAVVAGWGLDAVGSRAPIARSVQSVCGAWLGRRAIRTRCVKRDLRPNESAGSSLRPKSNVARTGSYVLYVRPGTPSAARAHRGGTATRYGTSMVAIGDTHAMKQKQDRAAAARGTKQGH